MAEYLSSDVSYREMEERYGISSSTLQRWVQAAGVRAKRKAGGDGAEAGERPQEGVLEASEEENLASEVKRLQRELHNAELHNKLLNAMIDIAEEQFDIPIRKKRGARPRSCWIHSH